MMVTIQCDTCKTWEYLTVIAADADVKLGFHICKPCRTQFLRELGLDEEGGVLCGVTKSATHETM